MNKIILASVFCLALSASSLAKAQYGIEASTAPAEGDGALVVFDPQEQTYSTELLDSEGLMIHPGGGHPGGGHPGGGHPGGGYPGAGHPPVGHPPVGHPGGGGHPPVGGHPIGHPPGGWHPGGWHPGGPWRPYPGWNGGWVWNRGWYPGWWRVGIIFPVWVWLEVPAGYWQCTAFNGNLEAYSAIGPDLNQAAYGALYNCGGPDYQQEGCYIPQGYCQLR